jgi:galacturonokinase
MSRQEMIERVRDELVRRYGVAAAATRVVLAPYRICPLGAHIDHQLGPVTAMALDRGVVLAYAPSRSREVRLMSLAYPGEVRFPLDDVPDCRPGDWGNFARGAVRALRRKSALHTGLVGVTAGAVSEGGLSSSAAIGVAYLLALEDVNGLPVAPERNVLLDQFIENQYLGLRNGILDPSAILLSRRDHLTRIDCATVRFETIPRPASMPRFAILIAFSGLKQALVATDYNRRVAECAEAAATLLAAAGRPRETPLLGRVSAGEYAAHGRLLTGAPARRAEHFFSEVDRVARGIEAWRRGDIEEFGRLVTASGQSSIVNYECGSPPLIDLYRILIETPGVYGARFSGAGFRGCCFALVRPECAEEAAQRVRESYARRHPDLAPDARVFLCASNDGARILR